MRYSLVLVLVVAPVKRNRSQLPAISAATKKNLNGPALLPPQLVRSPSAQLAQTTAHLPYLPSKRTLVIQFLFYTTRRCWLRPLAIRFCCLLPLCCSQFSGVYSGTAMRFAQGWASRAALLAARCSPRPSTPPTPEHICRYQA